MEMSKIAKYKSPSSLYESKTRHPDGLIGFLKFISPGLIHRVSVLIALSLIGTGAGAGAEVQKERASDKQESAKESGSADKSEQVQEPLTSAKVNSLLSSQEIYGEQYKVSSFINGSEVTIQTWTNPKSSDPDRDYKINSVLIAKTLLDAYPGQIKVVKVRYFDRQNQKRFSEYTVVPGVVKSFAAGIMSELDLLTTIPVTHASTDGSAGPDTGTGTTGAGSSGSSATSSSASTGGNAAQPAASGAQQSGGSSQSAAKIAAVPTPASASKPAPLDPNAIVTVLPGFGMEQRAKILDRIKELEKKGVKSPLARQMFATLEENVRDGHESEAQTAISRLESSISDMEKNYLKAKSTKANTASPIVVRAGSSRTSGTTSTGGAQNSGSDLDSGVAIYKKKLGDFYPHYGPCYVDRVNIANTLYQMSQGGQKIDSLRQSFLQMEAVVVNGGAGLDQSIKSLNSQLKLKEAPKDEEYNFQQKFADQQKGTDLK